MPLRIIINDREYTNPVVKVGLTIAFFIGAIAVSALIVFVLLPAIGITIVMSLGLAIVVAVGIFAAAVALTLGSAILASLIVLADSLSAKFGRRQ